MGAQKIFKQRISALLILVIITACNNTNFKKLSVNESDPNQTLENQMGTDFGNTEPPSTEEIPAGPEVLQPPEILTFKPGDTFYWQLSGTVNENQNVTIYDIDLEDNKDNGLFSRLQSSGKKVICYFSAGTFENWRSDANQFPQKTLGKTLDGWPGERWLDIRDQGVRNILLKRIDLAVKSGCDAIEPDNLDAYQNNNGFGLSASDQISFLHWLAKAAHDRGISIGLKNALDIIEQGQLADHFDWALNEQCYQYNECSILSEFTKRNKAVFIAEYQNYSSSKCNNAKSNKFTLGFYNLDLNGSLYKACPK